ncbi:MAG: DUF4826 family protein [Candidatus Obscuribacterales bacterium]|nr:DUF4826 family protein [Candidatus Obscuribacterales bacterium]
MKKFIDKATVPTARDAARAFSKRWRVVPETMLQGKQHSAIKIGDRNNPAELRKLGDLLQSRAGLLQTYSENSEFWSRRWYAGSTEVDHHKTREAVRY